jgi:hypothetical protein
MPEPPNLYMLRNPAAQKAELRGNEKPRQRESQWRGGPVLTRAPTGARLGKARPSFAFCARRVRGASVRVTLPLEPEALIPSFCAGIANVDPVGHAYSEQ